jgi:uncharacterized protein YjbI with pentapeptide repeats
MTGGPSTPDVRRARNWLLAHYDLALLRKLGLPPNHSRRIADRDFCGYRLAGAHLPFVELSGFALTEANLSRADLREARLCCVDLSGADLALADLREADLRRTDLRCANLRGADFCGASLVGADLLAADLANADLRLADIAGARLDQADVTAGQVRSARNWERATYSASLSRTLGLPDGHNGRMARRVSRRPAPCQESCRGGP